MTGVGLGNRLSGAVAFVFLLIGTVSSAFAFSELDLDPSQVNWSRLVFQAEDGRAEVTLRMLPRAEAESNFTTDLALEKFDDDDDAEVLLMTAAIESDDDDRIYRTEVWFFGEDGIAVQRIRDKVGAKGNRKTFRYFEDGVHRIRVDPKNRGEAKLPVEQWTRIREHMFAYGSGQSDCPAVLDPAVLLYAISTGRFTDDDDKALKVCVFNKTTLFRVQVRETGVEPFRASYTNIGKESQDHAKREIAAKKIVLEAVPFPAAKRKPDPFEFFEMGGDIEILVDPSSRLPLRISGEVSGFDVKFELAEVTVKP